MEVVRKRGGSLPVRYQSKDSSTQTLEPKEKARQRKSWRRWSQTKYRARDNLRKSSDSTPLGEEILHVTSAMPLDANFIDPSRETRDLMEKIIESKDLTDNFNFFLEKKIASENFLFYLKVCSYMKIEDRANRVKEAREITKKFIENGSQLEELRDEILDSFCDGDLWLFDRASQHILDILRGLLFEFLSSYQ
eukprot:TRINITY_DN2513_c0_g1_i1.p1 TRINITY_DN2513_c0_g1~~TRINITY_DN2513_c0_g1_i1.p1  ORF type:complete len:209 (+),score=40.49 TRINITY_DN2513_c0_g1_i1:49-627(+)